MPTQVVVTGSAGYVDGVIIALALDYAGGNADQVQLHGDLYQGPIECPCDEGGSSGNGTTVTSLATPPMAAKLALGTTAKSDAKSDLSEMSASASPKGSHTRKKSLTNQALIAASAAKQVKRPATTEPTLTSSAAVSVVPKRQLTIGAGVPAHAHIGAREACGVHVSTLRTQRERVRVHILHAHSHLVRQYFPSSAHLHFHSPAPLGAPASLAATHAATLLLILTNLVWLQLDCSLGAR